MFTTALVKSRQFRVVERNRMAEGIGREREMNASGVTSGDGATKQLKGAGYVFEASITELGVQTSSSSNGFSIGGLQLGSGSAQDELGMDIRVLSVQTGEVLDSINVRRKVDSSSNSVSGVGTLLDNIASRRGINTGGLTPDVSSQGSKRESIDRALRELIELAVLELAGRQKDWEQD
jgi:curli biogenesis system outer membrane secretion channel CsgG